MSSLKLPIKRKIYKIGQNSHNIKDTAKATSSINYAISNKKMLFHHLPDIVPHETNEGHFQKFANLSGTKTSESHLTLAKPKGLHKNTMRFNLNNIDTTLI